MKSLKVFKHHVIPPVSSGNDTIKVQCNGESSYTLFVATVNAVGLPIPFSIDTIHLSIITPQIGDVSIDGDVDAVDALMVTYHILGIQSLNNSSLKYADVNQDTCISIHDANLIAYFGAGLITSLPVSWKIGDVNMDDSIDTADVNLATRLIGDTSQFYHIEKIIADVDGNDSVTSNDSLLIEQYYLDQIDSFPFIKK